MVLGSFDEVGDIASLQKSLDKCAGGCIARTKSTNDSTFEKDEVFGNKVTRKPQVLHTRALRVNKFVGV
jgi:hypothetical protein